MEEFSEVLLDVQKEYKRSNKLKDIIIIILIVLMFLQSAFSFGCFVWYESQFEYKEKKTLQCIADEIGLSEIAVKKKRRKMLMKIGRMI